MQFTLNTIKFEDVRNQIIEYLKENSEYSATFDWSASNISYYINTMAYVSMLMSYQNSSRANNDFLESCDTRKTGVAHAKELGYRPCRKVSAQVVGTLSYVETDPLITFSASSTLIVNAYSKFVSNKGNIFFNKEPITLSYVDSKTLTGPYILNEGIERSITYNGLGEQIKFQSFLIPSVAVEESSLRMTVKNNITGAVATDWVEVRNIFNITSQKIYFVEEDAANEYMPRIIFGDNILGKPLSEYEVATLNYIETKGVSANNEYIVSGQYQESNFDVRFIDAPGFILDYSKMKGLSVPTNLSYGGRDGETLEEIKQKAPRHFSAAGRGVTTPDFMSILNAYPYIMESSVIGGNELFPGVDSELGKIYITGVPFVNKDNFLTSNSLYMSVPEEEQLKVELDKYNVVSTKLNFFKPSYIYVDVQPYVEMPKDIAAVTEARVKTDAKTDLVKYTMDHFYQFASYFRASKLTAVMDAYPDVISSKIVSDYSFLINKDSFYDVGKLTSNFINLPVIKNTSTQKGAPTYKSFVKTNAERRDDLGLRSYDFLPITERTIYGRLTNANTIRDLYNEDPSGAQYSNLMIDGMTSLFSFFRYPNNSQKPDTKILRDVATVTTNDVSAGKESFVLTINAAPIGTIFRTTNPYFVGLVSVENDIPNFDIPSLGDNSVIQCVYAFDCSGGNKTFTHMNAGEYAIFDAALSGGVWVKTVDRGTVSAETADGLYGLNQANSIYAISVAGAGGGLLPPAVTVAPGDYIIFNVNSTINPINKWEKMVSRSLVPELDSAMHLPKEVTQFDIKLVVNELGSASNFGGRTTETFYHNDLIFYNKEDARKWFTLINIGSSAVSSLPTIDAFSDELSYIDYSGSVTGAQIGDMKRVTGYGNFSMYSKIIWPQGSDTVAYENDILVYVGVPTTGADDTRGTWKIFQQMLSYQYEIDSNNIAAIPIEVAYGDYFPVVSNVGEAGNFQGDTLEYFSDGELIAYLGSNTWKKSTYIGVVDASSASGFPQIAAKGDVLTVIRDGFFGNTGVVSDNPHIDYTANRPFVDGDKIVFTSSTSGGKWYHLNEYSMEYQAPAENTKAVLNNFGYNSVFNYLYNYTTKYYEVYFNDKFNGAIIGNFLYEQLDSSVNSSDVGKIFFEWFITGKNNSVDNTVDIEVRSLFAEPTIFDKIKIIPRNKVDAAGTMIVEQEEDFDTRFNQFLAVKIEDIKKK